MKIFLLSLILNLAVMCTLMAQDTIKYSPIGIFHTNYTPETGAPRQGIIMPETKGSIEIYPEYAEGLRFVSFFEYIIVLHCYPTKL